MTTTRRPLAIVTTGLLATLLATRAADAVPTTDVQKTLGDADATLGDHAGALADLGRQLAQQAVAIDALGKQLAQQQATAQRLRPLVEQATRAADDDLDAARRDFADREKELRDATDAAAKARLTLTAQTTAAQRAASAERAAFAASPEHAARNDAVAQAQAEVDRLAKVLDARIGDDAQYVKLAAEARRLEAAVQAQRSASPADPGALAEASAAWIAASGAAETRRQAIFAQDASYVAADAKLKRARADVDRAEAAFEQSILTTPGVAEAQLATLAAKDAIAAANNRTATARREQRRAADVVAQRRAAQETLAKLRREAAANEADARQPLAKLQSDLAATAKLLAARAADATSLRATLRDAAKSLQKIDAANASAGSTNAGKPKR